MPVAPGLYTQCIMQTDAWYAKDPGSDQGRQLLVSLEWYQPLRCGVGQSSETEVKGT